MTERLEERLARLERERREADELYNDALTALDRALPPGVELPTPPPSYDASKLPEVNETWDVIQGAPPAADRSLKGRLRSFIWRVIEPALAAQRHFNATMVDHLNRNVASHRDTRDATEAVITRLAAHIDAQVHFQSRLLHLLQMVTPYVDTKDRRIAGGHDVLNAGVSALADDWMKRWESLRVRDARFVEGLALEDLRATASLAQQTALSLKREVERLLDRAGGTPGAAGTPTAPSPLVADLDAFKYVGFEEAFRGSIDDIRQRQREYVALFDGQSDVLDVGCGRGEFLELLAASGIRARGLDLNQAMVEEARARGLAVEHADALGHIASLPDASLGGLFAAQVVEHLAPEYLARLLEVAGHKMRPGGLIVLETINPACWLAFFESYIRDLTHVRPLHPETLQYLVRASGFRDVRVEYTSPVGESTRLLPIRVPDRNLPPAVADVIQTVNDNVEKLNARLFTFQDYAVIGRR